MANSIEEFLTALHNTTDLNGDYIELRAFNDGQREMQTFVKSHEQAISWARRLTNTHNVYVGVCPRHSKNGTNSGIVRSYWLWADIDGYKLGLTNDQVVGYLIEHICLPPTMIVLSGGQGGAHVYWHIDELTDTNKLQSLNNAIADKLKADRLGDPARILRVAGTLNHKTTPPVPVKLIHYKDSLTYTIGDLEAALRVDSHVTKMIATGVYDDTKYPSRSERDYAVVGALVRAGMTDGAIGVIFNEQAISDKSQTHSNPDHYISFTINKIRQEEGLKEGELSPIHKASKWNIIEMQDGYYMVTPNNELKQLSTFTFDPDVRLEDVNEKHDIIIGTVKAYGRVWPNVSFTRKAFENKNTLIRELPKMEWQFMGQDRDIIRLANYITDKLIEKGNGKIPSRVATPIIGYHNGVFVGPEQSYNENGPLIGNDTQVVWLPTGREHPKVELIQHTDDEFLDALQDFVDLYFYINEPQVVVPALGWYIAALFKPKFEQLGIRFPILNLFGTRGSGKTTLLREVLQPLIGYKEPKTYDANTTPFVMLALLGSTNNIPISFSEFRRSSLRDAADRFTRYILLSYDSGSDSRGRADQTTVEYPLCAPFTVDGEDAISDPACLERTIQLNLRPETVTEGTNAFNMFQTMTQVNKSAIADYLVRWSLPLMPDFDAAYKQTQKLYPNPIPDRVRKNMSVVVSGINLFRQFAQTYGVEIPTIDLAAIFTPVLGNVVSFSTGRTRLMVDEMVEDIINFTSHSLTDRFVYAYDEESDMFYMNFATAYSWWVAERRRQGLPVFDKVAVKRQLTERMVDNNEVPKPGNYVTGTLNKRIGTSTHHMHAISMKLAVETGLDIPQLAQKASSVKVNIGVNVSKAQ